MHLDGYRVRLVVKDRDDGVVIVRLVATLRIGGKIESRTVLDEMSGTPYERPELVARAERMRPVLESVARYLNVSCGRPVGGLGLGNAVDALVSLPSFTLAGLSYVTTRYEVGDVEHIFRRDDGTFVRVVEGRFAEELDAGAMERLVISRQEPPDVDDSLFPFV